ncbi:hypothetical protein ACVWXM_005820 [Bradyrhizobium sp. GM7.3]
MRSISTLNCGTEERNEDWTRCSALWLWPLLTIAPVMAWSLAKSLLPSRSSTCIEKPAALPMPWIGGGGSTSVRASMMAASLSFSP